MLGILLNIVIKIAKYKKMLFLSVKTYKENIFFTFLKSLIFITNACLKLKFLSVAN